MPATVSRSASPPRSATALLIGAFNGVLIAYLGIPPFRGHARHAVDRAQPGDGRCPTTPWCSEFGPDHDKLLALGGGAWLFGIANPVIYMLVAGGADRVGAALDRVRPLRLRHRRQRACGDR